ncbi:PilW family protein [Gudongella sp. DL1XJH-153]|uniref:PilW family protein n=1 Tax=Gudongella sp. DL1XJH-153 TaxID=3409804 RepID=UPI003BB67BBC
MFRNKRKKKGISLIELILTIAILSIVIQVIYSIFFVGQKSYSTSKDIGFAQQEARSPLNYIDKELRAAMSVYLNSEPIEYPYYSLSTENSQLVKRTYTSVDDVPIEQVLFSGINSIVFYPIWIDKLNDEIEYNILDMIIESQEGDIVKTYNMTIRFDNNQDTGTIKRILNDEGMDLKELEDQYILVYYTKYE